MKKLLSLPPNLAGTFHEVTGRSTNEYFCTHDPVDHKLGSGGGTTWLLEECYRAWAQEGETFADWLAREKRILIHAGGQSRRLPSYAPSGKVLTPVPVFRWERGQRFSQSLLDLQLPLYERIMAKAPEGLRIMIVSGDVYIHADEPIGAIPDADVVCFGLWLDSSVACNHGVFVSRRTTPGILERMEQKPSPEKLAEISAKGFYLTDIGVWLLSDRAVELLAKRSRNAEGHLTEYDLYSEFGCALGTNPSKPDPELAHLTVAILPLKGGEFYHYGTSRELISSTLAVQNRINDQHRILHRSRKPHPSIFVQNALIEVPVTNANRNTWIENSHVSAGWTLSHDNIITGVPRNAWQVAIPEGVCIDVVPVGASEWVLRPYGITDRFAGPEQQRRRFPVFNSVEAMGVALNAILASGAYAEGAEVPASVAESALRLLSAEEIAAEANLPRLASQRAEFRTQSWSAVARNYEHSVFYQLDLADAAAEFAANGIELPAPLTEEAPLLTRIHDAMFRSETLRALPGREAEAAAEADNAFSLLRTGLTEAGAGSRDPRMSVCHDQIVWARSPVRIDIAGGWTDTPPFCLMEGGNVINMAIELNGQPPLQTYIRPCAEPHIVCRSIDLGASETITTYEELARFTQVGSPFSIPKAACVLAGFHPSRSERSFPSLRAQLEDFGGGFELTLLSAIPAGSGLGTSSILAATVLGALSNFCALGWDKSMIGQQTLMLEQMLTTGGGWQDQYGGILPGVKLLSTTDGFSQTPTVNWLPDGLFTSPDYAPCHLLYYTGITRTAKNILAEIVRRMFLNQGDQLRLLRTMKEHTMEMYEAILRQDFNRMGRLVGTTWAQNRALDRGTNPPAIDALTAKIHDLCLGYKLPGAGGGGFLYMIAKDPEAATRIRAILAAHPTPNARFVDLRLSTTGLQVTRS